MYIKSLYDLLSTYTEEHQIFHASGYLTHFVPLIRLTSHHCSLWAGICKIHWRRIPVLLAELEAEGFCFSGWLSIISSFPLSELTYRKGLGILEVIRGLFSAKYQSWVSLTSAVIWFLLSVSQVSWHLGNPILPYSNGMSRTMPWNLDCTFTI